MMSGIVAAYAQYGAELKNPQWSWSAIAPDGEVILTLWQDEFDYSAKPPCYDLFESPTLSLWSGRQGNKDRIEHLKHARDHREGRFRVVVAKALDPAADPRKIGEAFARPNMLMSLDALDERTGEFKASLLSTSE